MEYAELPFNWAQVRAYVTGACFEYNTKTFLTPEETDFDCVMALQSLKDVRNTRDWLQNSIRESYEKRGVFLISADHTNKLTARCIAVRFTFFNTIDFNYFRLSCHCGHPIG